MSKIAKVWGKETAVCSSIFQTTETVGVQWQVAIHVNGRRSHKPEVTSVNLDS